MKYMAGTTAIGVATMLLCLSSSQHGVAASKAEEKTEKQQAGAETPKAALERMHRAVRTGDREEFRASVKIPESSERLFDELIEFQSIGLEFREKLVAAHGYEGLTEFLETEGGLVFELAPSVEQFKPDLNKAKIERQNDRATAVLPDREHPYELVRHDGRWFVDVQNLTEDMDERDVRRGIRLVEHLADGLYRHMGAIDREGVTPAELSRRVGNELTTAVRVMEETQ
jgi:hypothetical protein